ncbi:unannotated protein [freshwater metagenome]|uniref:Unannotated protein n=1 Tax=freshwater metagenome TaxID=449393 RepID=A0A6J6NZM0_9ZZZZ
MMPILSLNDEPLAVLAMAAPRIKPGLLSSSADRTAAASIASSRSPLISTPAKPDGTKPNAVRAE